MPLIPSFPLVGSEHAYKCNWVLCHNRLDTHCRQRTAIVNLIFVFVRWRRVESSQMQVLERGKI